MVEQPDYNVQLKVVWSKNKVIPTTSTHTIAITVDTSIDVESIKSWLLESLGGTLKSISTQTGAEEKLISIETIKS